MLDNLREERSLLNHRLVVLDDAYRGRLETARQFGKGTPESKEQWRSAYAIETEMMTVQDRLKVVERDIKKIQGKIDQKVLSSQLTLTF